MCAITRTWASPSRWYNIPTAFLRIPGLSLAHSFTHSRTFLHPKGTAVLELKQLRVGEETPVCLPMMGLAKNDKMQIPATGRLYLSATLRSKVTPACRVSCVCVCRAMSCVVSCVSCRVADGEGQDENKKRAEEPRRDVEGGAAPAPTSKGADETLGSGPVPTPRSSEEPRPAPAQPIPGPPSVGGVEPHKKAPSPPSTPRSAPPSAVRPLFLFIYLFI